jgi:hypothetical protein
MADAGRREKRGCRMTNDEMLQLEGLVRSYAIAHENRIILPEGTERRMVWASDPVKGEYDAVLHALRAAAAQPRHSDAFVEGYVDDLLQSALDDSAAIADEIRRLREVLEYPLVTRLYIPLDGIAVEEPELRLGNVRLVRMDDETFERLIIQPFVDIIRRNPVYNTTKADEEIERHRQRSQSLRLRTCVEVTTDRDLNGTFAEAGAIADDVCDFLQVCVAALRPRQETNPVRWSNGIVKAWRHSFGVSNGPRPRSNSHGQLAYGGPPTVLGSDDLSQLQENRLLALGDGLGSPPATEYDALLRRALRWFAKGERELHADDRKLAYVTAIDLFFSRPGPEATRRFCESFALAIGSSPDGVARLARAMYGVYTSRSQTSHAGAFDVESSESVDRLRWDVLQFLVRMANHAFQTKGNVEGWIAERRKAMTYLERQVLTEATKPKIVKQDVALRRSIWLIGGELSTIPFDNAVRQRVVLRRLLVDAVRRREYLLQLRPLAHDLEAALRDSHERGAEPVPVVLTALASLPWVADGLRERMASDFT